MKVGNWNIRHKNAFDLEPELASNGRLDDLKNIKIASTLAKSANPTLLKEAFTKAKSVKGLFKDAMFLYGTHGPIYDDLNLL
ncbi:hypothetical protein V499_06883 [Pseudogymnoascus sp. VKM F-103]|nr:hypothetical protein V499_06883 [Pseudogymnoascus sp. VKM F-103]